MNAFNTGLEKRRIEGSNVKVDGDVASVRLSSGQRLPFRLIGSPEAFDALHNFMRNLSGGSLRTMRSFISARDIKVALMASQELLQLLAVQDHDDNRTAGDNSATYVDISDKVKVGLAVACRVDVKEINKAYGDARDAILQSLATRITTSGK